MDIANPDTDGEYHLDAAAVCLPGFWRLKEKFKMSLDTLHFEAGVPHYAAKLQKSMNRFMLKLTPDKPVERNNVYSLDFTIKQMVLMIPTVLHPTRRRTPLVPPHGRSTRNRSSLFVSPSHPVKQKLT